jgi:thiamine biosynthesis lipoprotein
VSTGLRADAVMGTVVTIDVPGADAGAAGDRALAWFHEVEGRCTRFDERSELMQLTARVGEAVPVSALLYELVRFAVTVAEESGGAFDPTVGHRLARRGLDREHRTRRAMAATIEATDDVSYRDIALDEVHRTITLHRPLVLDLGAVAKGLAVDLAARELQSFGSFAIDAGGDLYLGGSRPDGEPWVIGIRHPRQPGAIIDSVRVRDRAVCTSGDYERALPLAGPGQHHILDPCTGASPAVVASVTVVAPSAMLADALGTAAFVLGPEEGLALLTRMDVEGLIVTTELQRHHTPRFAA